MKEGYLTEAKERMSSIKRTTKIYLKGNKDHYQNKETKWQEFNLSKYNAEKALKDVDLNINEFYYNK